MSNDKKELTIPSVHLNGSGILNLTEQYEEAITAVDNALKVLPVPHGRDYYVQEEGAFERAREQFRAQNAKLAEVLEELRVIYRGVRRQERTAS